MCCREAEGKVLLGRHGWRARRMWPLSACMALPSPCSFRELCIACLLALLLLMLLGCLSALYASLYRCCRASCMQSSTMSMLANVPSNQTLQAWSRYGAGRTVQAQSKCDEFMSAQRVPNALHRQACEYYVCAQPQRQGQREPQAGHRMRRGMDSERLTKYCIIVSGMLPASLKCCGLSTSGGHPYTAARRLCTSAARSGISCCQMNMADRQRAPPAG